MNNYKCFAEINKLDMLRYMSTIAKTKVTDPNYESLSNSIDIDISPNSQFPDGESDISICRANRPPQVKLIMSNDEFRSLFYYLMSRRYDESYNVLDESVYFKCDIKYANINYSLDGRIIVYNPGKGMYYRYSKILALTDDDNDCIVGVTALNENRIMQLAHRVPDNLLPETDVIFI